MAVVWEGYRLGGRYEVQELLGEGGTSAVYKGFDHNLKRTVAIKIIHPHLVDDEDFVRRFEAEARAVAQLHHPNIVQVYDFAAEGELYYMVLEYIPGESLQKVLRELRERGERLPLHEVLKLMEQIADAVAFAHKQGMVHRDLKPANILLRPNGEPVLTDFGLARMMGSTGRTRTGMVLGTVLYMSPEQVLGEHVDHRADIYALGVMLFELLTGRLPYEGESLAEVMQKHLRAPVPDPREFVPDLPPEVSAVVRRAMAKKPEERFQSALEFKEALSKALAPYAKGKPSEHTLIETPSSLSRTQLEPSTSEGVAAGEVKGAEQFANRPQATVMEAPASPDTSKSKLTAALQSTRDKSKKPTMLHMAALESAMLSGLLSGVAYLVGRIEVLWFAGVWWLVSLLLLVRYLPEWWSLVKVYRLVLVRGDERASTLSASRPKGRPFRFQVPRLEFPNDMVLMLLPAALAAVLASGITLAAIFGVSPTWLAVVWIVLAIPIWLFHLRFLALNFLQPGVLERLHFGHFLLSLSLGVLAVPGVALATLLPADLQAGALLLALGAFGVGGMLGALTIIFLLRRALSTGLPRPSFAPLVFFIGPLVAVYTIFTVFLFAYLQKTGMTIPAVLFYLTVLTAWGIILAGEALAVMVYQGYRHVGIPVTALNWGLLDAFIGLGLVGVATWSVGLRGRLVLAVTVVSAAVGVLAFLVIAWEYHRRSRML